jgi:hypothetical protein
LAPDRREDMNDWKSERKQRRKIERKIPQVCQFSHHLARICAPPFLTGQERTAFQPVKEPSNSECGQDVDVATTCNIPAKPGLSGCNPCRLRGAGGLAEHDLRRSVARVIEWSEIVCGFFRPRRRFYQPSQLNRKSREKELIERELFFDGICEVTAQAWRSCLITH